MHRILRCSFQVFGVKEKLRKEKRVKLSDLVAFLYFVDMSYLDVSVEHPGGCCGGGCVKTASCDGG